MSAFSPGFSAGFDVIGRWTLPADYNTCGELRGTLAGCREHLEAGEDYCDSCNAAWIATRNKLRLYTRVIGVSQAPSDDEGSIPAMPIGGN